MGQSKNNIRSRCPVSEAQLGVGDGSKQALAFYWLSLTGNLGFADIFILLSPSCRHERAGQFPCLYQHQKTLQEALESVLRLTRQREEAQCGTEDGPIKEPEH